MSENIRDVFHIQERGSENGEPVKTIWTKVGVAFLNRDQSLNVNLEMLPLNGRLHIRDRNFQKNQNKNQKYKGVSHE